MFDGLGGVVDIRILYPYSLYFSDQFSCIKFFDLSYGLKDIEFQSLNHFKSFSGIIFIIKFQHYPKHYPQEPDMWDPHASLCLFIKHLNKTEKPLGPHV